MLQKEQSRSVHFLCVLPIPGSVKAACFQATPGSFAAYILSLSGYQKDRYLSSASATSD